MKITNKAVSEYLDKLRKYRREYQALKDRSFELWQEFDALSPSPGRSYLDGAGGSVSQSSAVERAVIQRDKVWQKIKDTDERIKAMEQNGAALTDVLLQMPFDERQILIFRHVDGLTWDEVGKRLGMSANKASYREKRALQTLADILSGHTRPKFLSFLLETVVAG